MIDEAIINRINALLESYISRLEFEVQQCPPQLLPLLSEAVLNVYSAKHNLSQHDRQGDAQIALINNINKMIKKGDQQNGNNQREK